LLPDPRFQPIKEVFMSIHVAINHKTYYRYDRPVTLSPHIFRLRPAPHSRTPILAYSFKLKPENYFINWQQDPYGNYLARVVFPEKSRELAMEVDVVADLTIINPFDFFVAEHAEKYPFQYAEQEAKELSPYMEVKEKGPLLIDWLAGVDRSEKGIVDFLVEINQRLQQDIGYNIRMEPGVQRCEETLDKALGSCRDSGWLLVQILRHLGLAARFVMADAGGTDQHRTKRALSAGLSAMSRLENSARRRARPFWILESIRMR
jgi:transglutaminase-like putative cysteine protease